jgi:delta 1-pyrroline-5-carboxylate dehydrogenase
MAPFRCYAPVGGHEELLPYLVRRLLENGANTSFVHALLDDNIAPAPVAADPIARVEARPTAHPHIPAPRDLYGPRRRNAAGKDLSIDAEREALVDAIVRSRAGVREAGRSSTARRSSQATRVRFSSPVHRRARSEVGAPPDRSTSTAPSLRPRPRSQHGRHAVALGVLKSCAPWRTPWKTRISI